MTAQNYRKFGQVERKTKRKTTFFIFFAETQQNLSKIWASRVQKAYFFARAKPILSIKLFYCQIRATKNGNRVFCHIKICQFNGDSVILHPKFY
ncbi:MAG: hypothetical protein IJ613_07210 [Muribaculaceae bacterium]|nr:hypothetical protein [Muribaculaceae bacterium]